MTINYLEKNRQELVKKIRKLTDDMKNSVDSSCTPQLVLTVKELSGNPATAVATTPLKEYTENPTNTT